MKLIKYFVQFLFIYLFFIACKILGYKLASNFGALIGSFFGPLFRSRKTIKSNLLKAFPKISKNEIKSISNEMWKNYGRILSEYIFIKDFRNSKLKKFLSIEGEDILKQIKIEKKPVLFISGHFNNFELMAMTLEMSGINLAAIYRPLNNFFLDKIMTKIRKQYICKNQIPKGIGGTKKILGLFKNGYSFAMMIDQRVSEGSKVNFFNTPALTSTIPAQFVKKYNCLIVPVYIERKEKHYFKIKIDNPIKFNETDSINKITMYLNDWLEKKIISNPSQWIWSHNRWK